MAMNFIWAGFLIGAFLFGLITFFFGNDSMYPDGDHFRVFQDIAESTLESSITAVKVLIIPLIGTMAFWLGMMRIGEKSGLIQIFARWISPFFSKIFKGVPKDHPANGAMLMNFSANFLGMDNAATPLGLKAMGELQSLNPNKKVASDAQIMFLVMNTSGLTLIPTVIMADRAAASAMNPTDVFLPILMATFVSTLVGLITVSTVQKINLFQKSLIGYFGAAIALFVGLVLLLFDISTRPNGAEMIEKISIISSGVIVFGLMVLFVSYGLYKGINVFDTFIDGAKEGLKTAVKIIPYLVAILASIAAFKASGGLDWIVEGIRSIVEVFTSETRFVDALPTGMMKPISGSGARAMMVETWNCADGLNGCTGVDTFAGKTASVMRGATETTFYVLAVYFGSVGIKNTRSAVWLGLSADLAGIIAAILFSYLFFT